LAALSPGKHEARKHFVLTEIQGILEVDCLCPMLSESKSMAVLRNRSSLKPFVDDNRKCDSPKGALSTVDSDHSPFTQTNEAMEIF
jgi:hypothetical protein